MVTKWKQKQSSHRVNSLKCHMTPRNVKNESAVKAFADVVLVPHRGDFICQSSGRVSVDLVTAMYQTFTGCFK